MDANKDVPPSPSHSSSATPHFGLTGSRFHQASSVKSDFTEGLNALDIPSPKTVQEDLSVIPSPDRSVSLKHSYFDRLDASVSKESSIEPVGIPIHAQTRVSDSKSSFGPSESSQHHEDSIYLVTPPSEEEDGNSLPSSPSHTPKTTHSLNFGDRSPSIPSNPFVDIPKSTIPMDILQRNSHSATSPPVVRNSTVEESGTPLSPDTTPRVVPLRQETATKHEGASAPTYESKKTNFTGTSHPAPQWDYPASSPSYSATIDTRTPNYSASSSSTSVKDQMSSSFKDPFVANDHPSGTTNVHLSSNTGHLEWEAQRTSSGLNPSVAIPIQGPPSPPPWHPSTLPLGTESDMRLDSTKVGVSGDFETEWDSQHVKFPCSQKNRYYLPSNVNQPLWKWKFIQDQLKHVRTVFDLEQAIKSWSPCFASKLHSFVNLRHLAHRYPSFEPIVLPYIIQMAISLPSLFKRPIPLLRRQNPGVVRLSQKQCVSLLANMFLCTFPRRPPRSWSKKNEMVDFPSVSFDELFSREESANMAKLQCIAAYFEYHSKHGDADKTVEIRRQVITEDLIPTWSRCHAILSPCTPAHTVFLEQVAGHWQADFANKVIGGGVLGSGAVQEEIRFAISPECLVSRLICQTLDDNEAVLISGSQQYASYKGYGSSFTFTGAHFDSEVLVHNIVPQVIAFDALSYSDTDAPKQFSAKDTNRELEKALSAFSVCEEDERSTAIATGKWGCGVFKGNPSWKFLIQWIAASVAKREIVFCTLDDEKLFLSLYKFTQFIQSERSSKTTVGELYRIMSRWKPRHFDEDIFPFVISSLRGSSSHSQHQMQYMTQNNYIYPQNRPFPSR